MPHSLFGLFTVALVAVFALVSGCKDDSAEAGTVETVRYNIGDPLQDSSLAAVVTSDFGTDTLTTETYEGWFMMTVQQNPAIQNDPNMSAELRRSILEQFILQHLILGETNRLGLQADPNERDQQYNAFRSRFPSDEEFRRFLAEQNITEDSIKATIDQQLKLKALQERFLAEAKNPTEKEIESFRKERSDEVRARHILFRVAQDATAEQDSVIRTRAEGILDSVKAGRSFEELARQYSDDGSARFGGDLNYFNRGQMVKSFDNAVFALKDSGDVTKDLVKTPYGYHIIQLIDKRTVAPMDTSRARQMIVDTRRRDAVEAQLDRLRKLATVRLNPNVVHVDINAPRPEDDM